MWLGHYTTMTPHSIPRLSGALCASDGVDLSDENHQQGVAGEVSSVAVVWGVMATTLRVAACGCSAMRRHRAE